MSKIKAKNVTIKLDSDKIAGLTDCTFNVSTVTTDTRTKDSADGPCHEFNYCDWSASGNGEIGHEATGLRDFADLRTSAISGQVLEVKLVVGSATKLQGNAIISSLSLNAPADGKSTYSISLQGVGPLTAI